MSEDTTRDDVYNNLDWSRGDSGYNEGALCGLQALSGITGITLPDIPLEQDALGNIWVRVDMMNAAILAYQLGYADQAVQAATCSQIHNPDIYQLLSNNPDIVASWLSSN